MPSGQTDHYGEQKSPQSRHWKTEAVAEEDSLRRMQSSGGCVRRYSQVKDVQSVSAFISLALVLKELTYGIPLILWVSEAAKKCSVGGAGYATTEELVAQNLDVECNKGNYCPTIRDNHSNIINGKHPAESSCRAPVVLG
jgi:hypothetical protein